MVRDRIPPPTEWNMDVFRPFVESTLDEWKQGILFPETGLRATDTILVEGVYPRKNSKMRPYNMVVQLIAKKISKKYKLLYQQKKTMTILLQEQGEKLKAMILARQHNQITLEESTTQEGTNKERIRAVGIGVDLSPKQLVMKEKFEKTKKEILDSLPEEVKARFGQQYFCKWRKKHVPVLVLNPYNMFPGRVRDLWFKMYEEVKQQGNLKSATNLVYLYGAYFNPKKMYAFVRTSSLMPYATGRSKNYHKISAGLQKKKDEGTWMRQSEEVRVEGLAEMEQDRMKEPDKRHGRVFQAFLEDWEKEQEEVQQQVDNKSKAKSKQENIKERRIARRQQTTKNRKTTAKAPKRGKGTKRDAKQISQDDKVNDPTGKRRRSISEAALMSDNDSMIQRRLDEALSQIERLNSELQQTKKQVKSLESKIQSKIKRIVNLTAENEILEEEMEQMRMNHALELGFAEG